MLAHWLFVGGCEKFGMAWLASKKQWDTHVCDQLRKASWLYDSTALAIYGNEDPGGMGCRWAVCRLLPLS